jgi:regulator of replication initiation timing
MIIVLIAKVIKIFNKVDKITTSVKETTQNIHDIVQGVKAVITPAVITSAVTNWIERLANKSNKKKEDKNE